MLSCLGWCPSCYLELLSKLQKWIHRTAGSSLSASLEPLAHHQNVASLSFVYRYFFGRCSSELAQLVPLPYSPRRSTCYSDRFCFLSQFLDVTRISMSTVSFLMQLAQKQFFFITCFMDSHFSLDIKQKFESTFSFIWMFLNTFENKLFLIKLKP